MNRLISPQPITNEFSDAVKMEEFYDYIITGSGCAGLSLAVGLIHSGQFGDKKILLVDKVLKTQNDRTWCFWEHTDGLFENCVYKEWSQLLFHSKDLLKKLNIAPYTYKLIRGIDFYNYSIELIKQQGNFTLVQGDVSSVKSDELETGVTVNGRQIKCTYIFNSIPFEKPKLSGNQYWLLQHFKGWFIKIDSPRLNPSIATLMDFRTNQSQGTTFFYVLPFSETEALVEYTLFSHDLLKDEEYEAALKQYLKERLEIETYTIIEKEFGVIPMTNYSFSPGHKNLINIGTTGGQTKGSSGYTFQYIQKHSAAIVDALKKGKHPLHAKKVSTKFNFYDSVLLNILHHKTVAGDAIFYDLFKNNRPQQVLKFLDNETSLKEDLGIISSLPTLPFAKAALAHLFTDAG